MRIHDFFEKEMGGLDGELSGLAGTECMPLERLREELWLIRNARQRVHDYVVAHPFDTEAEEIDYHKRLYPRLMALHVFRVEVYLLNKDLPSADPDQMRSHYDAQLELIFGYIRRYEFLYHYFKLNADELDELYFTAKGNRQSALLPVLAEPEVNHTTETGYLFARFMAYEMLFRYIADRLSNDARPFKWTGENLNLIELLHGIHLTGQVNNGEVGIVELFKGMGDFFGVDLGIPKKGLDGLMKRKKLSRTHYTERVRDSLVQRMDEEDDWEREKRLKNKNGF